MDTYYQQVKPFLTRITMAYIYVMLTAFLFFTGAYGYLSIVESKYVFYLILTGLYLLAVLIGFLLFSKKIGFKLARGRIKLQTAQLFVLLYLLVTWVSALVSRYWPYTVIGASRYEGALTITLYCMSFLLISFFGRADRRLLMVFAVSVSAFAIICISQLIGFNPFVLYPKGYSFFSPEVGGSFIGTIGNTDLVSAFICICVPVLLIIIIRGHDNRRWLLLVPLLSLLFVLWKIDVLAGYIGVGLGSVIAICVTAPLGCKQKKIAVFIFIGLFILLLAAIFLFEWSGYQLLYEMHEVMHGHFDDSFGSQRLFIWRNVWSHVPGRIITGHGPDTMLFDNFEYVAYYDIEQERFFSYIDMAHNEYLNVIYHQGIIGLIAFLGILACAMVAWLRHQKDDIATAALGGAVLCYSIQAFFSFSMCMTAPYFWLALALLTQRDSSLKEERYLEKTKTDIINYIVMGLMIVTIILLPIVANTGDHWSNRNGWLPIVKTEAAWQGHGIDEISNTAISKIT